MSVLLLPTSFSTQSVVPKPRWPFLPTFPAQAGRNYPGLEGIRNPSSHFSQKTSTCQKKKEKRAGKALLHCYGIKRLSGCGWECFWSMPEIHLLFPNSTHGHVWSSHWTPRVKPRLQNRSPGSPYQTHLNYYFNTVSTALSCFRCFP